MTADAIEDLVPLTPASFHILLVLADAPAHGYAIMREVEQLTEGKTQLGPGTLYRTIQRLIEDRLIEGVGNAGDDERRLLYRLTRLGTAVARAEASRLAQLVRVAAERGLLPGTRAMRPRPRRGAST